MGLNNIRSDATKKADRKFEKKLEFYSKVRETVASLSATKAIAKKSKSAIKRQKKLKAYDLSLLNEVLPEVKEKKPQQPARPPKKLNCKSRQKLVWEETKRMKVVLNHPAFLSNPFAATHQYLLNTQPAPKAEPVKKSKDDAKKKRKRKTIFFKSTVHGDVNGKFGYVSNSFSIDPSEDRIQEVKLR